MQTRDERHGGVRAGVVDGDGVGGAHGEDDAVGEVKVGSRLDGDGRIRRGLGRGAAVARDGLAVRLLRGVDRRFGSRGGRFVVTHPPGGRFRRRGARRLHARPSVQTRGEANARRGGDARKTNRRPREPAALVEVDGVFLAGGRRPRVALLPVQPRGDREEAPAGRPGQSPEKRLERVVVKEQSLDVHRAPHLLLAHQLLAPAAEVRGLDRDARARGGGVHVHLSIARGGCDVLALRIPRDALDVVLVSLEADQPAT